MRSFSQSSPPELAVVMPVFNESANIISVLREWFVALEQLTSDFVLLVINDGSTDDTGAVLSQLSHEFGQRLSIIKKTNSGHGRSCREGYELALAQGARWIFQIDSDGQCDPKFLAEFFRTRAQFDCVFGYRQTRDDGIGRAIVSRCCRTLLWLMTGTDLVDANVPYRLMHANVLRKALREVPADFELQNIGITFALKQQQLAWKYFPIHFRARRGGENSINYRKIAKMGVNLLRDFRRITHEDSHPRWRARWARRRLAS